MKHKILILLAAGLVSTATLTASAAFADNKNDQSEIQLFLKAPHDMAAAVKAAEASSGGKAVGAEFSEKDGAGLWEVEMVNGTKRSEVKIDASTGAVVKTKDKGDIADKDHPVTLDMLGAPLTDLVTKAETEGAGKVMSIDFEHEDGEPVGLAVEIVKANGVIQDFILNPADGKLTPATGQSDEGQDEEDGDSGEGNG